MPTAGTRVVDYTYTDDGWLESERRDDGLEIRTRYERDGEELTVTSESSAQTLVRRYRWMDGPARYPGHADSDFVMEPKHPRVLAHPRPYPEATLDD